jgi:Predicted membrane protein
MKKLLKNLFLFAVGGGIYILIEIAYRGHSHWTMFLLGGLCFLSLGYINCFLPWETPLAVQTLIGSGIITALEFITGYIVNIKLGWHVWDYSNVPLNFYGQICLLASFGWYFLSVVGITLDDYLRYWIFGEERPRYQIL